MPLVGEYTRYILRKVLGLGDVETDASVRDKALY